MFYPRVICQVARTTMSSSSTYVPSDQETSLAKVGELVTFEITATNDGNVDVDDTTVSNELFKNDAGG